MDGSIASSISKNQFNIELAKNGPYSLFYAFKHNRLEYERFYPVMESQEALRVARVLASQEGREFISKDGDSLLSLTHQSPSKKPLNVMLVTMESMSADFMSYFGNPKGLTPNLDRIAGESMFFTNLYATGNRTDRGMESLTLSIPPTPGRSIIKREQNEGLYTVATPFLDRGYEAKFIYGGYGYFDNMNHFFGSNGFEIVDRAKFASPLRYLLPIFGVFAMKISTKKR